MTRRPSAKIAAYVGVAALALLAGLALGRPELVAVAAPLAVLVVAGLAGARDPELAAEVAVDRERALVDDVVTVEKINGAPGDVISLVPVLLVDGDDLTTAADALASATVSVKVVEQTKGPKIRIHKFKNKTGYHTRQGHRQPLTRVQVTKIAK